MNRDQKIYQKINEAVRLLVDAYELLNEKDDSVKQVENQHDFFTIKDFCDRHKFIKIGSIRNFIHLDKNNFNIECTKKIGKRIYIKEKSFFEWMDTNQI